MPSNYILTSEGFMSEDELYHWLKKGEAAKDHKYIKREWTNNRWKYWYKNDVKTSTKSQTSTKTTNIANTKTFQRSSSVTKTNSPSKLANFVNNGYRAVNKTSANSNTRASKLDSKLAYRPVSKTESKPVSKTDSKTDSKLVSKTAYKPVSKAEPKTESTKKKQSLMSKIGSALSAIGDKVVDSIGITDRRESESAKKELDKAATKVSTRQKEYDSTRDKAYVDNDITSAEKSNIKASKILLDVANNVYTKAGEKYTKEREEYLKTPLGKVENAVQKGAEFLKSLFGGSNNKYDELKIQAEKNEAEEARQRKAEEIEKQTEERNTVRKNELEKLLEKLKKNNPLPSLKLKTSATAIDEDMALVNPNYNSASKAGYDENCAKCSLTYDLRRRGYDVTAASERNEDGDTGLSMAEVAKCYKDGESAIRTMTMVASENKTSDKNQLARYIKEELADYGDGARGNMGFAWTQGGGHSIAWEVENGVVVFRDCQTNKKINFDDFVDISNNINWMRTDDLTPTEEILKYVRNR